MIPCETIQLVIFYPLFISEHELIFLLKISIRPLKSIVYTVRLHIACMQNTFEYQLNKNHENSSLENLFNRMTDQYIIGSHLLFFMKLQKVDVKNMMCNTCTEKTDLIMWDDVNANVELKRMQPLLSRPTSIAVA